MASRYERPCSEKMRKHWDENLASADAATLRKLIHGMREKGRESQSFWTPDRRWLFEHALWRLDQLRSIGMDGKRATRSWDPVKAMEKQEASADQRAKLHAAWEEAKDAEAPRFEPKWHQKWARHRVELARKHGCSLRKDVARGDWF